MAIFFKFIYLGWDLARFCQNWNNRAGFCLENSGCHAWPRFRVRVVDCIHWSTTSIDRPSFTPISRRWSLFEVISGLNLLSHRKISFAAINCTSFSSPLFDNIFLQPFLRILDLVSLILVQTSTICQSRRNVRVCLKVTQWQAILWSSAIYLLWGVILMKSNKRSEVAHARSLLDLVKMLIWWLGQCAHSLSIWFPLHLIGLGIVSILIVESCARRDVRGDIWGLLLRLERIRLLLKENFV